MKAILLILSLSLFTSVFSQSLGTDLLLYYEFDGNADDISGNSMHGTIVGATLTTDRFGNPNSAYLFDGIDDNIILPNSFFLKPQLPVTVAFWARFDDLTTMTGGQDYTRVFNSDYVDNSYTGVWIYAYGGVVRANFGNGEVNITSFPQRRTKIGTTVLQEGIWYHVVCIVRGADDMDIYIDCTNDGGTYEGTGGNMVYSSNPGRLGTIDNHVSLPPSFLKGAIDELAYWGRALSPSEVIDVCNGKLGTENSSMNQGILYPNPNSGSFNLDFSTVVSQRNITVVDVRGSKQDVEINTDNSINYRITGLTSGVYFIQVVEDSNNMVYKVVVE